MSPRSQSLLDVVDSLMNKGLALDAEIVLGLADIDLLYLRVGALLAAADRVFQPAPVAGQRSGAAKRARPSSSPDSSSPVSRTPAASAIAAHESRSALRPTSSPVPGDKTSRSVMKLVLTLVEFVRQLLERQAVRRVQERTLSPEEIERLGQALMHLDSTVRELCDRHGLDPSELNLDLGPLGTLR
jgi:hypothetical protein